MKPIKTLILGVGVVAIGFGTFGTTKAHAATEGNSEYVENVDIDIESTATINIKNIAANKHINSLDLQIQDSQLNFTIDGYVLCKEANGVDFLGAWAYFGGVGIGGFGQLSTQGTLHDTKIDVAYKTKNDIPEATEDMFEVPLNKVKNGHPALRIDPLEELEKARQAFNGSDVDFYKQDREIVLQRPISLGAICGKLKNTDQRSVGFETKNATIKIKYKGDAAVNETPVINAQLKGNMANQIDAGDQPFRLNSADFMANIPNHYGQCIPNQNPVIRVNYNITGDEMGEMDFRIVAKSNQYADYGTYYQTLGIAKNPKNSGMNQHFDFEFPLKELLSQDKYSYMAISDNKTYNHNMLLQARSKPALGQMSQWQDMDTAIFKHRCVPQLSGQLGNQGGVQGYDNGKADPVFNGTIKATPLAPKIDGVRAPLTTPTPKSLDKAAPVPAPTPKPMTLKAPAQVPTPKPLTIKPIEAEPVNELQLKTR